MQIQGTPAEWRMVEAFRFWLPEYRSRRPEGRLRRLIVRGVVVPSLLVGAAWLLSEFSAPRMAHATHPIYPLFIALVLVRRLTGSLGCPAAAALAILVAAFQLQDVHDPAWIMEMAVTMLAVAFIPDIPSFQGGGRHSRRKIASTKATASSSSNAAWFSASTS